MAAPGKPYGLIFPKKAQQKTFVKHAVFMDESDEESSVGESLQREAVKKQAMKQTKLEIQRALAEDSTVYEYDNIYDDIQQKKAESQASLLAGKGEKKPKYIQNILKAAELRKKEQEKRMEKKIQKEREMEGNAFDDKEAFVTSAYKKKLQERAEEEEREKREAQIEACLDVTKQKDLSGFYRHLLNQAVGEEATPQCSLREAGLKEEKPDENPGDAKRRRSSDEQTRPRVPSKETDNPDADSDSEAESSDEEPSAKVHTDGRANDKKETRRDSLDHSGDISKHRKRQRDSRSSSEEEKKPPSKMPSERQEGGRKGKTGHHRERDGDRRHHEKEDRLRLEGGRWRKEERDDRQKKKDRKERDEYDRDLKRERDKEDRYSQWEQQMKERQANHRGQPREGEKGREGKRERTNSSPQSEEEEEEEEEEDNGQGQKGNVGRGKETPSESKELKRKTSKEEAEQAEKPPDRENRFAKRSSQETVISARDRYLARQMARIGTKSYLEKEED